MPDRLLNHISHGRAGRTIAFLLIVAAAIIGLDRIQQANIDEIWKGQIKTCHWIVGLSKESNHRINSHRRDADALRRFLAIAAEARYMSYKANRFPADLKAANEYSRLDRSLRTLVFNKSPIVDCSKAVPRP